MRSISSLNIERAKLVPSIVLKPRPYKGVVTTVDKQKEFLQSESEWKYQIYERGLYLMDFLDAI
jgi:hypothetical protein